MTGLEHDYFFQCLKKIGPAETQSYYLERVQRSAISKKELAKCERLDFSITSVDRDRFRQKTQGSPYFQDCAGIYVHVNPPAQWSIKIGFLPDLPDPRNITQDALYYKQVKIIPWIDSNDAADLYGRSQDKPSKKAVCDYVWFYTLIQIWKLTRCMGIPSYAGIVNSDTWIELISA